MTYFIGLIEKRGEETSPCSLGTCLGHKCYGDSPVQWLSFRGRTPPLPLPHPRVHSGRGRLGPMCSLYLENQAARDHSKAIDRGGSDLAFVT